MREGLGVEMLLLCIKRAQMRWLRRMVRMPPGAVFQGRPGEEALGKNQDTLEGLYLVDGQGMPWWNPGGSSHQKMGTVLCSHKGMNMINT